VNDFITESGPASELFYTAHVLLGGNPESSFIRNNDKFSYASLFANDATAKSNCTVQRNLSSLTSSNRGDVSVTLECGKDAVTQLFSTTLTANRTVTLDTDLAFRGDRFRVVRTGLGAFTLNVGGLKTLPSGVAAFAEVEFNGTSWVLTGYGLL
jgi:hypothetical protein